MSFISPSNLQYPHSGSNIPSFQVCLTEIENELSKNEWNYSLLATQIKHILEQEQAFLPADLKKLMKVLTLIEDRFPLLKNNPDKYRWCLAIWGHLTEALFLVAEKEYFQSIHQKPSHLFIGYMLFMMENPKNIEHKLTSNSLVYLQYVPEIDWSTLLTEMEFLNTENRAILEFRLIKCLLSYASNDPVFYNHAMTIASQARLCDNIYTTETELFFAGHFIHYLLNHLCNLNPENCLKQTKKIYTTLEYLIFHLKKSPIVTTQKFKEFIQKMIQEFPHQLLLKDVECAAIMIQQNLQILSGQPANYKESALKILVTCKESTLSEAVIYNIVKKLYEITVKNPFHNDYGLWCQAYIQELPNLDTKMRFFTIAFAYVYTAGNVTGLISLISANTKYFCDFLFHELFSSPSLFFHNPETLDTLISYCYLIDNHLLRMQLLTFIVIEFIKAEKSFHFTPQFIENNGKIIKVLLLQLSLSKEQILPIYRKLFFCITNVIALEHQTHYNLYAEFLDRMLCTGISFGLDQMSAYAVSTMLALFKSNDRRMKTSDNFSTAISNLTEDNSVHVIIGHLLHANSGKFKDLSQSAKTKAKQLAAKEYTESNYLKDVSRGDSSFCDMKNYTDYRAAAILLLLPEVANTIFKKPIVDLTQKVLKYFLLMDVDSTALTLLLQRCRPEINMDFTKALFELKIKDYDKETVDRLILLFKASLEINFNQHHIEKSLLRKYLTINIKDLIQDQNLLYLSQLLRSLIFCPEEYTDEENANLLSLAKNILPEIMKLNDHFLKTVYTIHLHPIQFKAKNYSRYLKILEILIPDKTLRKKLSEGKKAPKNTLEFHYLYVVHLRRLEQSQGKDQSGFQKLLTMDLQKLLGNELRILISLHMETNGLIKSTLPSIKPTSSKLQNKVIATAKKSIPKHSSSSTVSDKKLKETPIEESSKKTEPIAQKTIVETPTASSSSAPEENCKEEYLSREQLLEGLKIAKEKEKIIRYYSVLKNRKDLNDSFLVDIVQTLLGKKNLSLAVDIATKIQDSSIKSKSAHAIIERAIQIHKFKYKKPALEALNLIEDKEVRDEEDQNIQAGFPRIIPHTIEEKRKDFQTRGRSESVVDFSKKTPNLLKEFIQNPRELKRRYSQGALGSIDPESIKRELSDLGLYWLRPGKGSHEIWGIEGVELTVSVPSEKGKPGTAQNIIGTAHIIVKMYEDLQNQASSSSGAISETQGN